MEHVLELNQVSYSYHTKEGETLALSQISFSLKKGEFNRDCRSIWLWQIHSALTHQRTSYSWNPEPSVTESH